MKIEVYREDYKVVVNGIDCKVNKQQSKGPNHEVVDISKVVGDEFQKWISLSLIPNNTTTQIELKDRKVVETQKYVLTQEEKEEVETLQKQINEIIENAKKRYVPTTHKDIHKMSIEELERYIEMKKQQLK